MGWPGPMTQQQAESWQEWLVNAYNCPSRADWYAAQITAALCSTQEKPLSASDCLIKFGEPGRTAQQEEPELTPEEHHQRLVARLKAMGCPNPEEVIRAGKPVQLGAKKGPPPGQGRSRQIK